MPHDAKQREPGAPDARTRIQTMVALGLNPQLVPDHKPMDRVNAARRIMPRVWFDKTRCKRGLECLRAAKSEWDQANMVFRKSIAHNWSSHGFDAFGHLAVQVDIPSERKPQEQPKPFSVTAIPMTVNDLLRQTRSQRSKWE